MNIKDYLKLYFIMGSNNCYRDPRDVLQEAIEGGVTLFQFREKGPSGLHGESKRQLAKDLQEICKKNNVPFIVNDDVDLALEIDADGVHVGQDDEPVEQVREKIGGKILGVSCHNVDEANRAIQQNVDYIGVGPMYPTETKSDTRDIEGLKELVVMRSEGISIPVVGIGGIKVSNAMEVIEAGADGVSVISAISQSDRPSETAKQFIKAMTSSKSSNTHHTI